MSRFIPLALAATFLTTPGFAAPPVPDTMTPAPVAPAAPSAADVPSQTLDLLPLKKALAPLASETPIRSQSTFQMTGNKGSMAFTFREDAVITAKRPGRFHVELTQVATDGTSQKHLTVVSNGAQVWTYRPGTRQYSVQTYRKFVDANDDVTALGLTVGGFYIGEGHEMATGFSAITATNNAAILAALTSMDVTLTRHSVSIGGHDDYVYRMALNKQSLTYQFYVDSATNVLQRVELSGTQKGIQIAFREDIMLLVPQPMVPKETFQFTPPSGSVKVPTVSVDPF